MVMVENSQGRLRGNVMSSRLVFFSPPKVPTRQDRRQHYTACPFLCRTAVNTTLPVLFFSLHCRSFSLVRSAVSVLKTAGNLGRRRPTANRWLVQANSVHRQIETYAFPVTCLSARGVGRWSGRVAGVDSVGASGLLVGAGSLRTNEQTSASGLCSFVRIVRRAWGRGFIDPFVRSFAGHGEGREVSMDRVTAGMPPRYVFSTVK